MGDINIIVARSLLSQGESLVRVINYLYTCNFDTGRIISILIGPDFNIEYSKVEDILVNNFGFKRSYLSKGNMNMDASRRKALIEISEKINSVKTIVSCMSEDIESIMYEIQSEFEDISETEAARAQCLENEVEELKEAISSLQYAKDILEEAESFSRSATEHQY